MQSLSYRLVQFRYHSKSESPSQYKVKASVREYLRDPVTNTRGDLSASSCRCNAGTIPTHTHTCCSAGLSQSGACVSQV